MSITSVSFTFISAYLPVASSSAEPAKATTQASAAPTAAPVSPPSRASDADGDRDGDRRTAGPASRLAQAIMTALHAIGLDAPATPPKAPGAGSTAPPSTPGGAAPPAAAGEAPAAAAGKAPSVASAVYQFAHELYAALRPAGRGDGSGEGREHGRGEGHRQASHGEHGWKSQGYGDIAQRLDALAQRLTQATSAASPAGGSTPVSTSIVVAVKDGAPPAQPTEVAAKMPATAAPATGAANATPTNPAPNDAMHPLVEAFTKLFNAVQPQGTAPTETDMTAKLGAFLKAMAESLSSAATSGGTGALAVGGLIDVKA
jgi:hypothetical protein